MHSWNDGVDHDEVGGDVDGSNGASESAFSGKESLGATPMGARVTAQLQHDERFYGAERERRERRGGRAAGLRARMGLGGLFAGAGDDDD